jgi:hypothetical protein
MSIGVDPRDRTPTGWLPVASQSHTGDSHGYRSDDYVFTAPVLDLNAQSYLN